MTEKRKSAQFIASSTGPGHFSSELITLEYSIPSVGEGLSIDTLTDDVGEMSLELLPDEGFPGTVELEEEPPLPQGLALDELTSDWLPTIAVFLHDENVHHVQFQFIKPDKLTGNAKEDLKLRLSLPAVQFPDGYSPAGSPVVLKLEPLFEETGDPSPVPLYPVELELVLEDQSPADPDGLVVGDLLYLGFSWELLANLPTQYLGGWEFEVDRSTSVELMLPVDVKDSDASPGVTPGPTASPGDGGDRTENWNFELPVPLQGIVTSSDGQKLPFELSLSEHGSAEALVDISGIPEGSELNIALPDEVPVELYAKSATMESVLGEQEIFGLMLTGGVLHKVKSRRIPEIDCAAARDQVKELEGRLCDCREEEAALEAAVRAFWAAKSAQTTAEFALQDARDAAEVADKAAKEAEQAIEDAEQAVQDARQALTDYINNNVPGCSAKAGSASEAGSYASPSQHGAGFACGSDFVGARVDNQSTWDSHRPQINDLYNAWKDAYHDAKKAKEKAKAAKAAAEQAKADVAAAQAALDAANQALTDAEAALGNAQADLLACQVRCASVQDRLKEARLRVRLCAIQEEHDRESSGGDSNATRPGGGTTTPGDTGGTTTPGDTEGGGTTSPAGGTGGDDSSGGGDDGEDVRPEGGWAWEQPPPGGETGNPDLDELRRILAKISELIEKWKKVKKELEENPLVEEVLLYESIADLLDNIGDLDEDVANALEEFARCNSRPLEELLARGGDKIDSVIAALTLLKGMIALYIIVDSDMPAGRKAALRGIRDKLNSAIGKLEELKGKAGNAAELAKTLADIKSGDIWPDDITEWLTGKLEEMLGEAAEDLARKLAEKAITRILGSKALPILGILKDLGDFGDALGKKWDLDDIDEAINKALKEAIARANTMAEYKIPCENDWIGRHVWIAGSEKDWENTEVSIKWVKTCWCADKDDWVSMDCPTGSARVVQQGNKRFFYFDKITLPKTSCNPCYITVEITIKRGDTSVTHSLLVGVQVC